MRLRITLVIFASFVSLFSAVGSGATPKTFLTLNSQPGDYIGQGITQTFTPADGTFSISNSSAAVSIWFNNSTQFWYLDFGSPTTVKFGSGEYDGAQRTAFRSPTRPGIDVSGDGRGCNTDTGRFLVSDFALNTDGTIARLAIDFEQHCEGAPPALYGSFRYNSSVAAVPRLAVASTYTLKGNAGTSDALVNLSLCLPSPTMVQVAYATADGTAVQGTDYVNTTGTVRFQPGIISQTISVPIIGDFLARGNKTFKVKLTAAGGAPIGVSTASVFVRDPNVALTALAMSSQPGDYIGLGLQYLITLSDGTFTPTNSANVVTFSINNGITGRPILLALRPRALRQATTTTRSAILSSLRVHQDSTLMGLAEDVTLSQETSTYCGLPTTPAMSFRIFPPTSNSTARARFRRCSAGCVTKRNCSSSR